MKYCYQIPLYWILLFSLSALVFSQDHFRYNAKVENKFSSALTLFQQGKYPDALNIFDSLITQKPIHQRTTAAWIMAGKTLYHMHQYNASVALLNELLKSYPFTKYASDAFYTLALNKLMLQLKDEAAEDLIRCLERTTNQNTYSRASSLFKNILSQQESIEHFLKLVKTIKKDEVRDELLLTIAEKYLDDGNKEKTDEILSEIINRKIKSKYFDKALSLKKKLASSKILKIGVILPLMKNYQSVTLSKIISEEIVTGMQIALDESITKSEISDIISLDIRDIDRDSVYAINSIRELAKMKEVILIIGPLYSNTAISCARTVSEFDVPLVVPIASSNGIASLGKNIFQVNPDITTRGKIMAKYAIERMGLRNLAILASSELPSRLLAETFDREVKRLGGKVITCEYYSKGLTDLSEQFKNIRRAGFKIIGKEIYSDNFEIPLNSIDGLFISISDLEEIGVIASQLKYFNIQTQLLGNNEWFASKQLEVNKHYLNGIIFQADSFYDESEALYQEFDKNYFEKAKKHADKYALMGYDILRLVIEQIKLGANTREKLVKALKRIVSYSGLHGKITFINDRVNSEMQILQFLNGEIIKIGEQSVN